MQKRRGRIYFIVVTIIIFGFCVMPILYYGGRPLPIEKQEELFPSVQYYRSVRFQPRMVIAHVVTVDLTMPGVKFMITPGNPESDLPVNALTTSQFLERYDVQLAINGDGFTPWFSHSIFDYYPHVGDPVKPNGFASSKGVVYCPAFTERPSLNITPHGQITIGDPVIPAYDALSVDVLLVRFGGIIPGLDDTLVMPRTAVGLNNDGSVLIIVVVDGRQPFYSQGMTLLELAEIMVSYGAATAMNLDGGGSSTLVVEGANGRARVLNSPIDNHIPGRERPVGNHLGISISTQDE